MSADGVQRPVPSRPLDVHRWSDYPELQACLTGLAKEIGETEKRVRARSRKSANRFRDAMRCIILDLYVASCADPASAIGVSLGKKGFGTRTRYDALFLTYDAFVPALRGLMALGYVEKAHKHFHDPRTGIGRVTRIRATEKLIKLLTGHGQLTLAKVEYRTDKYGGEVIVLRDKKSRKKRLIEYRDTKSTTEMRSDLTRINAMLATHWIDLCITDRRMVDLNAEMGRKHKRDKEEPPCVDFAKTPLRRIFNNADWAQGGRFYGGWWQTIPKEYRAFVTIDGKDTVEIDYSVMHPALMYAEVGAKLEGDAYDIDLPNVPREVIKRAFNMLVNALRRPRRPSDFNEARYGVSWIELLTAIKARHAPITKFLATGYGLHLQNKDAEIANRVMLRFVDMRYVCLPVHDSFIVYKALEEDLTLIMREEFHKETGAAISTRPKFDVSTGNDAHEHTVIDNVSALNEFFHPTGPYAGYDTRLRDWRLRTGVSH